MKLTPIRPEQVDSVWPWCAPLLEVACRRTNSNETTETLLNKCATGEFHLCIIDGDTPMVLERVDTWLVVVSMGGRNIAGRIGDLFNACALIAGYTGAKGISYKGRKGWRRLLAPFGFRESPDGFMEVELWA